MVISFVLHISIEFTKYGSPPDKRKAARDSESVG